MHRARSMTRQRVTRWRRSLRSCPDPITKQRASKNMLPTEWIAIIINIRSWILHCYHNQNIITKLPNREQVRFGCWLPKIKDWFMSKDVVAIENVLVFYLTWQIFSIDKAFIKGTIFKCLLHFSLCSFSFSTMVARHLFAHLKDDSFQCGLWYFWIFPLFHKPCKCWRRYFFLCHRCVYHWESRSHFSPSKNSPFL